MGIIGVVAAITIPTIVANYQKKSLISQFKKSYSNLFNALNLVQVENGLPYECYYSASDGYHISECNEFFDDLKKKINIIKDCYGFKNICHPSYKTKADVLASGGEINNMACSMDVDSFVTYYTLSDGSLVGLQDTASTTGPGGHSVFLLIDVNGLKAPNRWGYDLYMLTFYRNNINQNVILSNNVCAMKEKGGMYIKEVLSE